MKILKYPNPFLFKRVQEVKIFDKFLEVEIEEMKRLMLESNGIGLAANQVGLDKKIFIMKIKNENRIEVFINPEIINKSSDMITYEEGCLSFPELYINLNRSKVVILKWQDVNGEFKEKEFDELESICIQHEYDHINGIVFTNNLNSTKRQLVLNKYLKKKK